MEMKKKLYIFLSLNMVLMMVSFLYASEPTTPTKSETKIPYYQGKVITFVVNSSAGGGTDTGARVVARHLVRFIPGNPNIVIRNMAAGAGNVAPGFVERSKKNGLTALFHSSAAVSNNLFRPKGIDYRLEEMEFIFGEPQGAVVYGTRGIVPGDDAKNIQKAKNIIFGHEGPMSGASNVIIWAQELLKFPVDKYIFGVAGDGPALLATIAGEYTVSGAGALTYNAAVKPYVRKGELLPLFQCGIFDDKGNIVREPALPPDVMTVPELYQAIYGRPPDITSLAFKAVKTTVVIRSYGKALLFPKGTPRELVDIIQKAAIEMIKDPAFMKDADIVNPGAPRYAGVEAGKVYKMGVQADPIPVNYMKGIWSEKFGLKFD